MWFEIDNHNQHVSHNMQKNCQIRTLINQRLIDNFFQEMANTQNKCNLKV